MSQSDAAEQEIDDLLSAGQALVKMLAEDKSSFIFDYQMWYTKAAKIVNLSLPDRELEFRRYYEIDPKRKDLGYGTYVIQDYCMGVAPAKHRNPRFNCADQASRCLINQVAILQSVKSRLDSIMCNMQQTILADVRDRELETAQKLMKVSVRAAGALAGVVLERHLQQTCDSHGVVFRKSKPTLSDFTESLKTAAVIQVPEWRKLSYLADVRNICCHSKGDEPTGEQVKELIDGVNWALKTVN